MDGECTVCAAGTYPAAAPSACAFCAAGNYQVSYFVCGFSSSVCLRCNFNITPRIATTAAQASCCAAGTYLATIGATALAACLSCDAGSYSATGAAGCTPCAAGTYHSVAGAASCRAW